MIDTDVLQSLVAAPLISMHDVMHRGPHFKQESKRKCKTSFRYQLLVVAQNQEHCGKPTFVNHTLTMLFTSRQEDMLYHDTAGM